MKLDFYQIDAFTHELFGGNSAGVIVLDEWLDDELMQKIAMENNISETAFVKFEDGVYNIRWFSPLSEIDFCGHATLAAAFVLFKLDEFTSDVIFRAKAVGDLIVEKQADEFIKMTFPIREPKVVEAPAKLLEAINKKPIEVLLNPQAYIFVLEDEKDVLDLEIDLELIKTLAPYDVCVTAASKEYDFISRYFWPANGGDEDPVTGSMHTGLVPYWAKKLNKDSLKAFQASKRGGLLMCELTDDNVIIKGQAVQYLKGTIEV